MLPSATIEAAPPPPIVESYPQLHEHLQNLPIHLVEHVGGAALRLSHIDMHPTNDIEQPGGPIWREPDFSIKITDPGFDESLVEAQALEAAHAGSERLGKVLHRSSSLLSLAHETLIAEGHEFGADNTTAESESEELRTQREHSERQQLFHVAEQLATKQTIEAKESGDGEATVETLEALMMLQHLRGVATYDDPASRATYRELVHAGVADEVILAAQESQKIKHDGSLNNDLAKSVDDSRDMLSMATGKEIDYDYSVIGETTPDNVNLSVYDTVLSVLAVVTAKSDMPESDRMQYLEKLKNFSVYDAIQRQRRPDTGLQELSPIYKLAERVEEGSADSGSQFEYDFQKLLGSDNPQGLQQAAESLGIGIYEAASLFCLRESTDYRAQGITFNEQAVRGFTELVTQFPEYKDAIVKELYPNNENHGVDFGELHQAIQSLSSIGLSSPDIVANFVLTADRESMLVSCQQVADYMSTHNMTEQQLAEALSSWGDLSKLAYSLGSKEQDPTDRIERALIESSIMEQYLASYGQLRYPTSIKTIMGIRHDVSEFPLMEQRLARLGLSPDLTADIFRAWSTYNNLAVFAYTKVEFGNLTKPTEVELKGIAQQQADSFIYQMQAIESFQQEFGAESMNAVIDNFGIYSFIRYEAKKLNGQLEGWQRGETAKTVVVNSRADWNSYTGKPVNFEDESDGEGVFYFEANSAPELSKIAIGIGAYERAHGREPDVGRFIVHGHGNRSGMTLGVNGEHLEVSLYESVARSKANIRPNDYRQHLGPNFSVILQSCSTAGEGIGENIASTMATQHRTTVVGSKVSISGLKILSDGSVEFLVNSKNADLASGALFDGR